MEKLSYFLPQPAYSLDEQKRADFDQLFAQTPPGALIDYQLPYPKWQFLTYLCQANELVLHGSPVMDIGVVEPRKAIDVRAFSNQKAIYATTDGIWVIYFSIVDRGRFAHLSLFNTCMTIRVSPDQEVGPLYFFSITHEALLQNPWSWGTVYILPRAAFSREPDQQMHGAEVIFPHWISAQPAQPAAKLAVGPQDFPFLDQVHGHDDELLTRLAAEEPGGFPWPAALLK